MPEIAGLALAPTLALTPEDAQHLGLATGEPVTVHADGLSFAVTLQIDEAVVPGTALLTVGLDGVPALDLPALAELASGEPR